MISTGNRIVFRADGNSQIGLGHIMRSAALSQMLNAHFECVFIVRQPTEKVKSILKPFGKVIVLMAENTIEEINELKPLLKKSDVVVVDGYLFNQDYLNYIQSMTDKLIIIDDFAKGYFNADLVINHANEQLENIYHVSKKTRVLCGFQYLILRDEFLRSAHIKREVVGVDTAFICMGGADPSNVTIKVLESCIQVKFIKNIIVVTGVAYSHQDQLTKYIDSNLQSINIVNYVNVDAARMVDLIACSQIAICPASSIALEVCCVQGGLLTGFTVNNQMLIHDQLVAGNYADSVGDFNAAEIDQIVLKLQKFSKATYLNSMMDKQFLAIDGKSAERILDELKNLLQC